MAFVRFVLAVMLVVVVQAEELKAQLLDNAVDTSGFIPGSKEVKDQNQMEGLFKTLNNAADNGVESLIDNLLQAVENEKRDTFVSMTRQKGSGTYLRTDGECGIAKLSEDECKKVSATTKTISNKDLFPPGCSVLQKGDKGSSEYVYNSELLSPVKCDDVINCVCNKGCITEHDTDYEGNDLTMLWFVHDPEICREYCRERPKCKVFTLNKEGYCHFKTTDTGRRALEGATSGNACRKSADGQL